MSDIVERLRSHKAYNAFTDGPLVIEAADEIERLRSRLAEAEKVIEPFARAAACAGTAWPDNGLPSHVVGLVNLGHLRAARAWKEASNG